MMSVFARTISEVTMGSVTSGSVTTVSVSEPSGVYTAYGSNAVYRIIQQALAERLYRELHGDSK